VDGAGLKWAYVGREARFTVRPINGANAEKPWEVKERWFDITMVNSEDPSNKPVLTIKHTQNGVYLVTYTPTKIGKHELRANLLGIPLIGTGNAGATVEVMEGPQSETCECAEVAKDCRDTEPLQFKVQTKNSKGNKLTTGGVYFDSEATKDGVSWPVTVVDNQDGTYTVTWLPDHPGVYELHVGLDGKKLKGSPFSVKVHGASVAANSPVTIAHEIKVTVNVKLYDKRLEAQSRGGDIVVIEVLGKAGPVPVELVDNNDGSYQVTWIATAQEYKISATLEGKHCQGSPFTFVVPPFEVKH